VTRLQDGAYPGSQAPRVVPPWWVLVAGLGVIGVGGALVGGVAGDSDASSPPASTTSAEASASAPPTTVPRPAPSSTVPAEPTAAAPTSAAPTPTAEATSSGVDFVMPDLVGSDLQSAQNAVQELGVLYSVSHDLLGSRNQVVDSNWVVCDQNITPGQRVTGEIEGQLDFGVVKREEACP